MYCIYTIHNLTVKNVNIYDTHTGINLLAIQNPLKFYKISANYE